MAGNQQLFLNFEAGEDLTRGNVLFLSSDLIVKKAKADADATMFAMGIAEETVLSGDTVTVMVSGLIENFTHGFGSPGDLLYVSEATAGALTSAAPASPNIAQQVAQIESTDILMFGTIGFIDTAAGDSDKIDTVRFENLGSLPALNKNIGGAWTPARPGTITNVVVHRRKKGTAGTTKVDLNKNGVTIFTTQTNRPTINETDGDNFVVTAPAIDITTFAALDYIQVQLDEKEKGNPKDLSITLEFQYDVV